MLHGKFLLLFLNLAFTTHLGSSSLNCHLALGMPGAPVRWIQDRTKAARLIIMVPSLSGKGIQMEWAEVRLKTCIVCILPWPSVVLTCRPKKANYERKKNICHSYHLLIFKVLTVILCFLIQLNLASLKTFSSVFDQGFYYLYY